MEQDVKVSDTSESLEQPWYGPKRINAESGIPGGLPPMTAEQEGPYRLSEDGFGKYPFHVRFEDKNISSWNNKNDALHEIGVRNESHVQGRKSRDEELERPLKVLDNVVKAFLALREFDPETMYAMDAAIIAAKKLLEGGVAPTEASLQASAAKEKEIAEVTDKLYVLACDKEALETKLAAKDEAIANLNRFRNMAIKAYPTLATIPFSPLPLTPEEIEHGKKIAEALAKTEPQNK